MHPLSARPKPRYLPLASSRPPFLTTRQSVRLLILSMAAVAAALAWYYGLTAPASKAGVIWGVGLGFFSALLTALTIVIAVTTTPQTRWPAFGDLIGAIAVISWLIAAGCGILLAAAGDIWNSDGLTTVGLVLCLVQVFFGMDTLVVLMRFRSANGRRAVLARLTTRRLHRAADAEQRVDIADAEPLTEFWEEIDYSIDRRDVAELGARVVEVVDGWHDDVAPAQAQRRLALLTHLLERVSRSMLYESLSGDAARATIPQIVDGALRASWQLGSLSVPNRGFSDEREPSAAVALGQICRVIGWLLQASHERLQQTPLDVASRQILSPVAKGRFRVVRYVDPDPPDLFRTPQDPWPNGFSDPEAVLIWLTVMCEFGGSYVGNGLYILCDVLTESLFYGDYWEGDCIFSEMAARIGPDGSRSERSAGPVAACGGLGSISLELAATVLAGLRNRRFKPPDGWEDHAFFSVNPLYLRSQLTMFATYDCLPDDDAARDWLVETLTSAPTSASLTNMVIRAFGLYGEPGGLPLRHLGERPAAVTLAALIRLAHNHPQAAKALSEKLPGPLIAGALQQARFALSEEGPATPEFLTWNREASIVLGTRHEQEQELMGIINNVLSA